MDWNKPLGRALWPVVRRLRSAFGNEAAIDELREQNRRLRRRIGQLDQAAFDDRIALIEEEIAELRGLSVRVTELTDLVAELVVYEARHRDDDYREIVTKYVDAI
jgi:hypothetical protein